MKQNKALETRVRRGLLRALYEAGMLTEPIYRALLEREG